jgi:hypothetical protein
VRQGAKTGKDLFTQLISNGYDCSDAYQNVIDNGNGIYDPLIGATANFTYVGNADLQLVEKPLKIGVTPSYWDNIGALLKSFGYDVSLISLSDLLNSTKLSEYDILAINCGAGLDSYASQAKENIKNFVQNGGKLYASDWSYIFVKEAFPGYINFPASPKIGYVQTVAATIVDANLSKYLGVTETEIVYDLGAWVVIDNVGTGANVLITGNVSSSGSKADILTTNNRSSVEDKSGNAINTLRPLSVSFNYGEGKVVYTSFHNEAQVSESIRHILEYFTVLH